MVNVEKYQVVIIEDDEQLINNFLVQLKGFLEIEVVGIATDIITGKNIIDRFKPDLIFLDVELGNETAFELLKHFKNPEFEIVFTTAHERYALDALKLSAMDYLLKPFGKEDIRIALDKLKHKRNSKSSYQALINNLNQPLLTERLIGLKALDEIIFVKVKEILSVCSEGSYSRFRLTENRQLLVSENLKKYETILRPPLFYRIHHSHLINTNEIKRMIKINGGSVELSDGNVYPLSRRKKDDFLNLLKSQTLF
jgi:two-component system LytT family response regulator